MLSAKAAYMEGYQTGREAVHPSPLLNPYYRSPDLTGAAVWQSGFCAGHQDREQSFEHPRFSFEVSV